MDSAVTEINQNPLTKSSIPAARTSMKAINAAVANVVDTAEAEFDDQVTAVKDATAELDRAVDASVERATPSNIEQSRTALADVTTAVNDLAESTSSSC